MKWYSVKTHSPPYVMTDYLVVTNHGVEIGHYMRCDENTGEWTKWSDKSENFIDLEGVTHFCIPDPVSIESCQPEFEGPIEGFSTSKSRGRVFIDTDSNMKIINYEKLKQAHDIILNFPDIGINIALHQSQKDFYYRVTFMYGNDDFFDFTDEDSLIKKLKSLTGGSAIMSDESNKSITTYAARMADLYSKISCVCKKGSHAERIASEASYDFEHLLILIGDKRGEEDEFS